MTANYDTVQELGEADMRPAAAFIGRGDAFDRHALLAESVPRAANLWLCSRARFGASARIGSHIKFRRYADRTRVVILPCDKDAPAGTRGNILRQAG